jgi:hypothetical protein
MAPRPSSKGAKDVGLLKHAGAILLAALLSGCIYSNVAIPLDTDLDETKLGANVGRSEAQSILWLFAWGDAGIQAAAKRGRLTTLRHADQRTLMVLFGLYTRQTTIVYGD